MKRTLMLAAAMTLVGFAALANPSTWTVKFESAGKPPVVVVFKADGTSVDNTGNVSKYTFDEATNKICGAAADGPICLTLSKKLGAVGDAATYTDGKGGSGSATMTAIN